jgi:hypothetical protein
MLLSAATARTEGLARYDEAEVNAQENNLLEELLAHSAVLEEAASRRVQRALRAQSRRQNL